MSDNPIQNLGPYPEDQILREELARLRASLTALLLQKDELQMVRCRQIEAAYLRRFGALELKVYETWCSCLRAKRKVRLIRARQNRRERPDLGQIEAELDGELAGYREELEHRFAKVAGVIDRRGGPGLSNSGAKELKDLYRQAVKALHPDLHPDGDERRERTLNQVMRAYRSGDLKTLRTICDTMESAAAGELDTLDALRAETARLRIRVRELNAELEQIKAAYPYNVRIYLEDEARGHALEAELTQKLRELCARTARYEAQIVQMLAQGEGEEVRE